ATEQSMVADESGVAVRYVVEATHQGELFGIPATGRGVRWDAIASRTERSSRSGPRMTWPLCCIN
ncbi:MAG: SnoaL-like polyketide cyclase, partial [Solirubrobacteraceae bacterium]|nr:SnoaL-like polyketide cyclase [Solirubrobacteraceae bacterium]